MPISPATQPFLPRVTSLAFRFLVAVLEEGSQEADRMRVGKRRVLCGGGNRVRLVSGTFRGLTTTYFGKREVL